MRGGEEGDCNDLNQETHRSEDRGKGCEQRNVRNVVLDTNPFPTLLAPHLWRGCQHVDFSPVMLTPDVWPPEL